ncbi:GDSL-type esterase/lipase family protein [Sporosarcina sp. FSL K6-2383]|uniref:GDSL-type esterase/lipase family protein n=1 Tax=Sporosarcina sp. FSL K6-2383 TaxID=2921556 RepID=UPI00315A83F6
MKKIMILGDSLSLPRPENFHTFDPFESLSLGVEFDETYPYLLQKNLSDYYVINRSVRASTIKQIYNRDRSDHIFLTKPDVVIVHVGIVDLWPRVELNGRSYLSETEFATYYIKLLSEADILTSTRVICIGIAPTSLKMSSKYPGVQDAIEKFNEIIKSICSLKEEYSFIDLSNVFTVEHSEELLMKDGHHLNPKGNKIIAQKLIEMLEDSEERSPQVEKNVSTNLMTLHIKDMFVNQSYFFDIDCIKHHEKVIIYGAGELGKSIYRRLLERKIVVEAFIDQNQAGKFLGVPIIPIDVIDKSKLLNLDKVIIASYQFRDEMFEELNKRGIGQGKTLTYSNQITVSIKKMYEMIEVCKYESE